MKGINYSFLRAVCALVIGLVLVLFPDRAIAGMVTVVGVLFMLPSLISLISFFAQKDAGVRRFPIEGAGSLLFGFWLVIMPGFFVEIFTLVLGFVLTLGGVQQIASLMAARKWSRVPAGFFVVPVLILVAGLVALFNPSEARRIPLLIIGFSSMVYAVFELVKWFKFTRFRPVSQQGTQPDAASSAQQAPKKRVLADDDDITDAEIIG